MRCAVCYLVLSVLLSLTRRYCVEYAERTVRLFQRLRSPVILIFSHKTSWFRSAASAAVGHLGDELA